MGVSGMRDVHIIKKMGMSPTRKARTYQLTKAPKMKVTNMPNAREEAESDPKRPLILGDEHSLTYKGHYNPNYSTVLLSKSQFIWY